IAHYGLHDVAEPDVRNADQIPTAAVGELDQVATILVGQHGSHDLRLRGHHLDTRATDRLAVRASYAARQNVRVLRSCRRRQQEEENGDVSDAAHARLVEAVIAN